MVTQTISPHSESESVGQHGDYQLQSIVSESWLPDNDSPMLDAASAYARQGFRIFPAHSVSKDRCTCNKPDCGRAGKHPRTIHGLSDATTDEAQIQQWWKQWPDANIGGVLGEHFIAVDIDPRNGGNETWDTITKDLGAGIEETLTSETGGGGRHLIYRTDSLLPNAQGAHKLGAGVDVKHGEGYIILPPSRHKDGPRYRWALGACEPIALPLTLRNRITRRNVTEKSSDGSGFTIHDGFELPSIIPEGERNETLLRYAGKLRREGATESVIIAALRAVNPNICSPPLIDGEIVDIAKSAVRYSPQSANGEPFSLLSLSDLIKRKPPEWLIHEMFPCNSLVEVVGAPGVYKSFLALDWALCIAAGRDWLDRKVKSGHVVYIAGEGVSGIPQRAMAWSAERKREFPKQFHLIDRGVSFLRDEVLGEFMSVVDTLPEKPALIVVDTLARCFASGGENDTKDMSAFVGALDAVRHETGATIVILHHENRAGGVRGNTALDGAVDVQFHMKRDVGRRVKLIAKKVKDGSDERASLTLVADVIDVTERLEAAYRANGTTLEGANLSEGWSSIVLSLEASVAGMAAEREDECQVLQALQSFGDSGATDTQWKNRCLADEIVRNQAHFNKVKKRLVETERVGRADPAGPKVGAMWVVTGES